MQWVIVAIRNLCEGNTENQKLIALLTEQEHVDSTFVQQMGLTLSNHLTAIPLATLNSLRKHPSNNNK